MASFHHVSQSPSLVRNENNLSSSPDPLATSANDGSAFLRSSPTKSTAPSPRKRRTAKILQDVTFSSPRKVRRPAIEGSVLASQSQVEHLLSPWKIRVTVEAEPEEAGCRGMRLDSTTESSFLESPSPSRNPKSGKRNYSASKQNGGRRQATDGAGKPKRRSKVSSCSRLIDLDTQFLDESARTGKELQGSPGIQKSDKQREVPKTIEQQYPRSSTVKGFAKKDQTSRGRSGPLSVALRPRESPQIKQLDFNRVSVRNHHERPKPDVNSAVKDRENYESSQSPRLPVSEDCMSAAQDEDRAVPPVSPAIYPTPDASVQDGSEAGEASNVPADDHYGFDTILESEGFTMIDLESIPSTRQFVASQGRQSQAYQSESHGCEEGRSEQEVVVVLPRLLALPSCNKSVQVPAVSYLALPEGESDLSSTVPWSTPLDGGQQNRHYGSDAFVGSIFSRPETPHALPESSPRLPSPPRQLHPVDYLARKEGPSFTSPHLAQTVKAGTALQSLFSPRTETLRLEPSPMKDDVGMRVRVRWKPSEQSAEYPDDLQSENPSELPAGTFQRAKRDSFPDFESSATTKSVQDMQNQRFLVRDGFRVPPVTTPDHRSIGASSSRLTIEGPPTNLQSERSVGSYFYLDTVGRERRWQLEREAVSRQIDNANSSQVIVIDSDDDDREDIPRPTLMSLQGKSSPLMSVKSEADEDIWLVEVDEAQHLSEHRQEDLSSLEQQLRQRERTRETDLKPRGRGQDDVSVLLWPQDKHQGHLCFDSTRSKEETVDEVTQRGFVDEKERPLSTPQNSTRERTAASEAVVGVNEAEEWFDEHSEVGNTRHPQLRSGLGFESTFGGEEEESNEPSLPPQPMKIAVNFNDSTDLETESQLESLEDTPLQQSPSSPCRPATPRSALKGTRAGLHRVQGYGSPIRPRVAFSLHSMCRDGSGIESSIQVGQASIIPEHLVTLDMGPARMAGREAADVDESPAPCAIADKDSFVESLPASAPASAPQNGPETASVPVPTSTRATSVSYFSKLIRWGSRPTMALPSSPQNEISAGQPSCGASGAHGPPSENDQAASEATIPSTRPKIAKEASGSTSMLSSASDSRLPPCPASLSVGGYFSDNHYKHLHILYLKSLKATFTRPGSIRPGLEKCIGQNHHCGYGAGDSFGWTITERDVEVVERWMRSFEGRESGEKVGEWRDQRGGYRRVEWSEADLCLRLFSIVAGRELRREQGEAAVEKQSRR